MKSRAINPFGLRMPPELKGLVSEEAKKNRRSLNAELNVLIEEGMKCRERKAQA